MPGELIHQCESPPVFAEEGASGKNRDISPVEMRARWARLTSRERQIVRLIVTGLKSREMAGQLGISARTIEVHRAHIMLKMDTKRVPVLVRWVLNYGLCTGPPSSRRPRISRHCLTASSGPGVPPAGTPDVAGL